MKFEVKKLERLARKGKSPVGASFCLE